MFRNSLKIALRNLLRHRATTAINVGGLGVGLAAAIFTFWWVVNEYSYNRYHQHAPQIYRVNADLPISDDEVWHWAKIPFPMLDLLRNETPEVTRVAAFLANRWRPVVARRADAQFAIRNYAYVSEDWFDLFDHQVLDGSLAGFHDRLRQVILTRSLANRLFGSEKVAGRTLELDTAALYIAAVIEDRPTNSGFERELILPLGYYFSNPRHRSNTSWGDYNYVTFVQLHPGSDPQLLGEKLTEQLRRHQDRDRENTLTLQALGAIYFDTRYENPGMRVGDLPSVRILAGLGLIILILACVNYVSLTTARASTRAREVGLRKIIGAGGRQVFGLLFAESLWTTAAALLLALIGVNLALPYFNQLAEQTFRFSPGDPVLWAIAGGTWLATLVLAGLYPATFLNRFSARLFLVGQNPLGSRNATFRRWLVVLQFALTAGLILGALVLYQQRTYLSSKDLGYDRSRVFELTIPYGPERQEIVRRITETLARHPAVAATAAANGSIVDMDGSHSGSLDWEGRPADFVPTVGQLSVDAGFAELFRIPLVAGRWFRPGNPAEENHVILNEEAVAHLGLPEPVVGSRFSFHGREGRVIGVVKDFHFQSLREPIRPLVLHTQPLSHGTVLIRPAADRVAAAVAAARAAWAEAYPAQPFEPQFLDDRYADLHGRETRTATLFRLLALLAIGLSALGLFGLSLFIVEQKRREIGIRKVLGASIPRLVYRLTADLFRLIGIALAIGIPLTAYLVEKWLQQYAYRIELSWWLFALAGLIVIVIALLTVSLQSVKAAVANPVDRLRE